VIGRGILAVTADAVRGALGGVVERGAGPGGGAVTFRALAREVIGRLVLGMATDAVGRALGGVVERRAGPGGGAVAF